MRHHLTPLHVQQSVVVVISWHLKKTPIWSEPSTGQCVARYGDRWRCKSIAIIRFNKACISFKNTIALTNNQNIRPRWIPGSGHSPSGLVKIIARSIKWPILWRYAFFRRNCALHWLNTILVSAESVINISTTKTDLLSLFIKYYRIYRPLLYYLTNSVLSHY